MCAAKNLQKLISPFSLKKKGAADLGETIRLTQAPLPNPSPKERGKRREPFRMLLLISYSLSFGEGWGGEPATNIAVHVLLS